VRLLGLSELRLAAAANGDKGSRMKFSTVISVAAAGLLVACGEKAEEVKAPVKKSEGESSVDALLGNAAAKPATPPVAPAGSAPPAAPAKSPPPKAAEAAVNPLQPGNASYDRNVKWLQILHSGTPAEKQAVRLEIARAGLSPKEMEDFQKMKAHFGIKD
jgi:hypothetical protein